MLESVNTRSEAGRTGHRLQVQEAKRLRMDARNVLGTSREGPPNVLAIVRAADYLNRLLRDATAGELELVIGTDGGYSETGKVLRVLSEQRRAGR